MVRLTAAGILPELAELVARGQTEIGPGIYVIVTSADGES
jgi:hypothetical protein